MVKLDTLFGNVAAVMIFPADDATDKLLRNTRPTGDNLNQLRAYANFDRMRWARPKRITVLS